MSKLLFFSLLPFMTFQYTFYRHNLQYFFLKSWLLLNTMIKQFRVKHGEKSRSRGASRAMPPHSVSMSTELFLLSSDAVRIGAVVHRSMLRRSTVGVAGPH